MKAWQRLGKVALAIVYGAPWLWVVCFGAFVWAVTSEVGHLPSYSNPDPKHVVSLEWLYLLVVALLGLTVLSPVIVAAHVTLRAILYPAWPVERARLLRYAAGAALVVYVIIGNPAGLSSWLFD